MTLKSTRFSRRRLLKAVSERITGPVVAVAVNIGILLLLAAFVTIERPPENPDPMQFSFADDDSMKILEPLPLDPIDQHLSDHPRQDNLITTAPIEQNIIHPPAIEPAHIQPAAPSLSPLVLQLSQSSHDELSGRQQTAFGTAQGAGGDLQGTLYDLKRDRKGRPRDAQFA